MHEKIFVLLPVEEAKSSIEARKKVFELLSGDPEFTFEEGIEYEEAPICDYLRIGGLWTGELNTKQLIDDFYMKAKEISPLVKEYCEYNRDFIRKNRKVLNKIWKDLGGKCENIFMRDVYKDFGYEDDAVVLNQEIAEKIGNLLDSPETEDLFVWHCLEHNAIYSGVDCKDFIGKVWIVVVDISVY
jgi:hypothetical protein